MSVMTTVGQPRAAEIAGVGLVKPRIARWKAPLSLKSGATLEGFTLAYESYGRLNGRRDNAILIMHALSGDAHVAGRHRPTDRKPGWWDAMIGPGRAIDTDQHFVLCVNVLGGCRGSSGPSSTDPATGRPFGLCFPMVTIPDMVAAQLRLLDRLGIQRLRAVVGGSMGGMQALELAIHHPDRVQRTLLLATAARHSAQQIAWNHIGRQAIMRDPRWREGDYYGQDAPADGLALARMVGHVTYLSDARLTRRFDRDLQFREALSYRPSTEFAVESYLDYQGAAFVDRFDANSYLYITRALDYYDAADGFPSLTAACQSIQSDVVVISFDSDWLYPPEQSEQIVEALHTAGRSVSYYPLQSWLGHDAFLLEDEQLRPIFRHHLQPSPPSGQRRVIAPRRREEPAP